MSKKDIPGARHLSSKAKKMWDEGTSDDNLSHFRGVCYNLVHTYCFFVCRTNTCEGCKVADVRSWMASLKVLPQKITGTPVVKEFTVESAEEKAPRIEVDEVKPSESETD